MSATGKPTTAARPGRREVPAADVPAILPAEALEILTSALQYCQQAGLSVQARNHDGRLVLAIGGARLADDGRRLLPAADVPAGQEAVS